MAAALALFGGSTARAQSESAADSSSSTALVAPSAPAPVRALPPIQIRISIARASEAEGPIDPLAKDIYEHVPKKYHSISMVDDRTVAVLLGEEARVKLPTGSEVRLVPVAVHGGQLHLQLEMPDVVNTSMRLANSRAFYVGGVRMGNDTLVFKLVPEFTPYVSSPDTRTASRPTAPDVKRASDRTTTP
ncbi:MAG TPA: hypothetical protein VMR86_03600 [Myxococcota bacterium]|nr:hypothetical protein [Myxococcota bacterium]